MSDPHWIGARYELLEQLGDGAEGSVWRGWDLVTGADCVARIVHLDSSGPNRLTAAARWGQLVRTVQTVARLAHPGLVTVDDIVADEDSWVLITRHVPGESLAATLARSGALPAAEASELVAQLCDALTAAHGAGLAHGRVKPANLLLEPGADGTVAVRLTDFGVAALECWAAQHAAPDATTTEPVTAAARAWYRPPEWIPGMPITAAGDVYATGVLLYEALAGHSPFAEADSEQAARRYSEPPARPGDVPDELWAVLTQCLEKRPRLRPTAQQTAHRLREATQRGTSRREIARLEVTRREITPLEITPSPSLPIPSAVVSRRGGAHVRRAPDAPLPARPARHRHNARTLRRIEVVASATAVALIGALTYVLDGHGTPPPRVVPTKLTSTQSAANGAAQPPSPSATGSGSSVFGSSASAMPGQTTASPGCSAPTTISPPTTTDSGAPAVSGPANVPVSITSSSPATAPSSTATAPSGGLPVSDPIGYLEQLRAMIQQMAAQGSSVVDANAAGDLENLVLDLENGVRSYQQNGGQGLLEMIKAKISGFDQRLAQDESRGLIGVGAGNQLAAYLQKLCPA